VSRLNDAKRAFASAIEEELDELLAHIRATAQQSRAASKDMSGLNDLAASFNGIASTLEHAMTQVEDTRAEARKWLGIEREPITQYVSTTAWPVKEEAA
jgi:methyl-accepting chemotaxis protein